MSPKPSVVIVDDHAIFRSGVRAELEDLVAVRGEAGSVEEAVRLITAERPDVVVLDVHMPAGGGVEVIRRVRISSPNLRNAASSGARLVSWLPIWTATPASRCGRRGRTVRPARGARGTR